MKLFCIPAELADTLKKAAKRGEFDIGTMYEMDSASRRKLFEPYTDKEMAKAINTEFEKAMVSDSVTALKRWAEKTFNVKEKKTKTYTDILTKIEALNDAGVLTPETEKQFLSDLVASKVGINLSVDQAKEIADRANTLKGLKDKITRLGDPDDNPDIQMEYWQTKRQMDDYLESLTPSGKIRVLTSTIARGNMLMRIGSVTVNINSNNIEGTIGAVVRRFNERAMGGVNTEHIGKLLSFYAKVYRETGYDLTRMVSMDMKRKVLGEEIGTSQGPGAIRKIGRWYEDKVFNLTQGLPDVMAASIAFGDRANIMSAKIARAEGLRGKEAKTRALELFKDATMIEPQTPQGQEIRNVSIADAQRSTNTDKRIFAEKLLKFRQLLNVHDLRFGDMNIPFVKTTANAIQSSLQHSGITVPVETIADTIRVIKYVQSGQGWKEATKAGFSGFGESVVRAGIGFFAAWLVANAIDTDDYMGIYPTTAKERELLELRKAVPNSIRVGDTWISLDWFGPLMAPLVGNLNAKKYGKDIPSALFFYTTGALYQVQRMPGLDFARQSLDSLNEFLTSTKEKSLGDTKLALANYFVDFTQSRFIPGFVSQVAQATDDVVRDVKRKEDILAPLKAAIPGLRETLPENLTIFGETTETEGWKVLLFGGRVKTGRDNKVVAELVRLQEAGSLPSITDVSKTSSRAKALQEQVGETRFRTFLTTFGQQFKQDLTRLISRSSYSRMSDEEKKKEIEDIKSDLFEKNLKRFGYRKPKK